MAKCKKDCTCNRHSTKKVFCKVTNSEGVRCNRKIGRGHRDGLNHGGNTKKELCGTHAVRKSTHGDVQADIPIQIAHGVDVKRPPCPVPDCDKDARGWQGYAIYCDTHAQRMQDHGSTDARRSNNMGKTCSIDGCEKDARWKEMCDSHASAMHNRGTVEETEWHKARRGEPKAPCSVPNCENLRTGRQEYCEPHVRRLYKTGDLGLDTPIRQKSGDSNDICIVPLEDGSPCGNHSRTHPLAERNNPDWKWGRVCAVHYGRYCRHGLVQAGEKLRKKYLSDLPLSERIPIWLDPDNGYVTVTDNECLAWEGALSANGQGYAVVPVSKIDDTTRTSPWLVHRLVWEHFNGPIPTGNHVHHVCGTRRCINPEHLECIGAVENVSEASRIKQVRDKANEEGITIEELREWIVETTELQYA